MKYTKTQLYALIRECYSEWKKENLNERGSIPLGGLAGALGAAREPLDAPLENQADSIIQDKALQYFVDLGLEEKVAQVMVDNIAISDLTTVLEKIPKIDTAAEGDDELYEEDDRVSKKISHLKNKEGMSQDQAVATAINMDKEGRLTKDGGYKKKKKGK